MKSLMDRALEYVGLLGPGAEILDDTDGPVVRDFRHLLKALLYRRGLFLEAIPGGQRVTRTPPWLVRRLETPALPPVWCCRCSRSLFHPDCEHGVRYVIEVDEPDWWVPEDAWGARSMLVVAPGGRA